MARGGSKPGERRGGRQKGTPNKTPKDVQLLAQEYTARAIVRLAEWMDSDDPTASVKACSVLLERAHGKAPQHLKVDGTTRIVDDTRASQIRQRLRAARPTSSVGSAVS